MLKMMMFGTMKVTWNEVALPSGSKYYQILAILALARGAEVSRTKLVNDIWGASVTGRSCSDPRKSLNVRLSELSKKLGSDLKRTNTAVSLTLMAEQCDVLKFYEAIDNKNFAKAKKYPIASLLTDWEGTEWVNQARKDLEESYITSLEKFSRHLREQANAAILKESWEEAISFLRQARELQPSNQLPLLFLIQTYDRLKRYEDASRECQEFLQRNPETPLIPEIQRIRHQIQDVVRRAAQEEIRPQSLKAVSPTGRLSNLPRNLSDFVARSEEINKIHEWLSKYRLVTLTGMAGIGKTSLAIHVASSLPMEDTSKKGEQKTYQDGVFYVDLSHVLEEEQIAQSILASMRIPTEATQSFKETLVHVLNDKRCLLLLDNCDPSTVACRQIVDILLADCCEVTILVTSQLPLGLAYIEKLVPIPPLSLPTVKNKQNLWTESELDELGSSDAVALFLVYAKYVQPNFKLDTKNANDVQNICIRLGGIPLAVELAALQMMDLTTNQILPLLEDQFPLLLQREDASVNRRHIELGAALETSHALLPEREQILLQRLSLFVGGWTAASALAVSGFDSLTEAEMARILSFSQKLGFLKREDGMGPNGEIRYRFLEIIRELYREKLKESGDEVLVIQHFVRYFMKLAENQTAKTDVTVSNYLEWEHSNFLETFDYLLKMHSGGKQNKAQHDALKLTNALAGFWRTRGYISEGQDRIKRILACTEDSDLPAIRMQCLHELGNLSFLKGDYPNARECFEQYFMLCVSVSDHLMAATTLLDLSTVARSQSDYARAKDYLRQCKKLARTHGISLGRRYWSDCGILAHYQDQNRTAISCLKRALGQVKSENERANRLDILGFIYADIAPDRPNYFQKAMHYFQESLEIFRTLRHPLGQARVLDHLGATLVYRAELFPNYIGRNEDLATAFLSLSEAFVLREENKSSHDVSISLFHLGLYHRVRNDYKTAWDFHCRSLSHPVRVKNSYEVIASLEECACVAACLGWGERAAILFGAVEVLRQQKGIQKRFLHRNILEQYRTQAWELAGESEFNEAYRTGFALDQEAACRFVRAPFL